MFAYCNNNPVKYCDFTGTQPAWIEMGFKYDGSMTDFRRIKNGLPPLAYEKWLNSQETLAVDIERFTIDNATCKVKELTNMTQVWVDKKYLELKERHNQYNWSKLQKYLPFLFIGLNYGT